VPSILQAHQVFSNLRWVAAALAVVAAMGAAYSLGSGVSLKKLILPAVVVMLSGALARVATTFKGKMEFQDYRYAAFLRDGHGNINPSNLLSPCLNLVAFLPSGETQPGGDY
jgi:hypothetical protein